MAKKKPDPAAVAQRKQERVAFVQAHPNLAPEQARQQFYVQTRTEELSAAGKSVDKKALRDKFQSGQVSREGFYTPGDRARFNTGSGSDGSLADSKLTDPPAVTPPVVTGATGVTGHTPTVGYRGPSTSYMAPQTTTSLGTVVPTTSTVPGRATTDTTTTPTTIPTTTVPVTDAPPKTVLIPGNISGQNVRVGTKQAQPKAPEKTFDQWKKDNPSYKWTDPATSGIDPVTKLPDVVIGSVGKDYKTSGRGDSALEAYTKEQDELRGGEFKNWEGLIGEAVFTTAGSVIGARGGPLGSAVLSGAFNYAYNMLDPTDNTDSSGDAFKRASIVGAVDLVGGTVIAGAAKKLAPVVGPVIKSGINKIFGAPTLTDDAIKAADDIARTMDYSPFSPSYKPGTASPKPRIAPKIVDPIARQQAADAATAAAKPPKPPKVPKVPKTPRADKISMSNLPKDAPYVDVLKSKTTRWNAAADAELAEQARQAVRLDSPIALPGKTALPNTVEPIFPNQPLALPRGDIFQTPAPVVETPKVLSGADRLDNAAAVVARNSRTKPPAIQSEPVQPWTTAPTPAEGPAYRAHQRMLQEIEAEQTAQTMDGTLSLGDWKQIRTNTLAPETDTLKVVAPDALPTLTPAQKSAATKARNKLAKETANAPAAEAPTGAAAPRDFTADLRKDLDVSNFDHDPELTAWVEKNEAVAQSVVDDWSNSRPYGTSSGTASGTTSVNDLSGISGQRVSRSDLFGDNRFGRRSPMDRGMFIEDAGAQPVGNLNPTPTSAANILEYKGIKYTVNPDNPMIGIEEGTGVQFTLRKTKSGKPGTPHSDGVDAVTGKPKLRTPRTKFADDTERKAAEKIAEQTRTSTTSAKRAEGAITTEQVIKAAQEKANAGAIVTQGEFPVAPKLRGKKLQQYNRDVASGKIKIDDATGKTKGTYEPSIASQEPFVYSKKAVTQDPVIGQGSIPNKSVTSLGTTKAPVKPMDDETFKKLSNDMTKRASNPSRNITETSRVAQEQYDEIVAVYGQESADKLVGSVRYRQRFTDKQILGDEVVGVTRPADNIQAELESASVYVEWFKSPEAQKMLIDDPARYYTIVNNKQNIAAMEVVGKANKVNAGTTAPRSMRQANNDVNSSLAEHQTALQAARTKEEVVFGINADTPTPAAVDANFTDAGYADSAFAKEEADIARGIAWQESKPSQPIRDTPWERSYKAKQTASADAAETIDNGSDDEVLALARKYEIPVSGETPADVAKLRNDLARKLSKSDSGPGRTGSRPTRTDGTPAPVKPIKNDLVAQGLNKAQIKEAYDVHRKAYQDWADEAVFDENPFSGQLRFAEASKPSAKNVAKEYTTVHPDGTPEPQLTPMPPKIDPDTLMAKIGKDGYKKADMDAELAAREKLRADTAAIRAVEVEAKIKWSNEATTTGNVKAAREDKMAEELNQYFGEQRELLITDPEKYHAIRQGIEERRIAQYVASISNPEGEAARAGAAAESARMAAHRAELEMPEIVPDANVLQQEDWVSEASRRFFGRPMQTETIPVARTPRSAVPEVSVADWEASVNQRFNNPSGNTPRLRRPGAPDLPFEAGENTLGDLNMIPEQIGMSGAANDLAAAQARQSSQSGTSALSGYVDDAAELIPKMKAELGALTGKLSKARTLKQQKIIEEKMRDLQSRIDYEELQGQTTFREETNISERDKDNYEFDLGLD